MAPQAFPISRRGLIAIGAVLPLSGCMRGGKPASVMPTADPASMTYSVEGPGGRTITITEWSPSGPAPIGTILFSHGANLAPDQYLRIVEPLASEGWRVLAPLHTDSEKHPETEQFKGFATWRTRIEDMRILSQMVEAGPLIAAGHSYGGLTALVQGGAGALVPEGISGPLSNPNIDAVIAFSPPGPIPGFIERDGYAKLTAPALVQTGTLDMPELPGVAADSWQAHLAAYEAASAGGDRYGLVLEGVDHYFGGCIGRLKPANPLPDRQLGIAVEIARLFAAAHGLRQSAAQRELMMRLNSELPVRLLHK